MRIPVAVWQGPAALLLVVVGAADTVWAQGPNAPEASVQRNLSMSSAPAAPGAPGAPGTTRYPFWGTAPQSFGPSRVTIPVPAMSPAAVSNAARAMPNPPSVGVGVGGGFVLSFMAAGEAIADNKAHLWLRVPKDAEIWFDGTKTKQTGELRHFFSPPLTRGKRFSYEVRLRFMKDGKPVEETQRLVVEAGQTIRRDFTQSR